MTNPLFALVRRGRARPDLRAHPLPATAGTPDRWVEPHPGAPPPGPRRSFGRRPERPVRLRPPRGRASLTGAGRFQRHLAAPRRRAVQRLVAHDRPDPPARGRLAPILMELFEHDDPALLERIVSDVVVARHAPGQRQEPAGTAADPLFEFARQKGTPDCFPQRGTRRRMARRTHDRTRSSHPTWRSQDVEPPSRGAVATAPFRSRCARSRRPSPCPPSGRRASSSSATRAPRSAARAPASPRSTGTR